jgi:alpha-L-fucosidase 2
MTALTFSLVVLLAAASGDKPPHTLTYDTPATTWDEAMPLGNGTLGALVWGDGAPLNISLDRTDLWDLRPVPEFSSAEYTYETMRQWEKEGKYDELIALYEAPYNRPAPTKIPAGRLEVNLGGGAFKQAVLELLPAQAVVGLDDGSLFSVWVHATEPVGVFGAKTDGNFEVTLKAPVFAGKEAGDGTPSIVAGELSQLGYPPAVVSGGSNWSAYEQEGHGGFRWAVFVRWSDRGQGVYLGAWSVATSREGVEPLALAKRRAEDALDTRDALSRSHNAWWRQYWDQSSVSVPNTAIERQYYLDMYKFGAASRKGAPPITLQGPWTADDGKLPPWKGDYHHDLNTQLSYWPCYTGNRLTEGGAYVDWLWSTRQACIDWTKRFFNMPGMNVPMTADLANEPIGGWRQYTMSSTTGAWLAQHFYLHWQYSRDGAFLRDRAYPYLRDVATFLEAVTAERDAEGKRTLPLSSSPEIHDNKPNAWFPTITNHDLALIRWCFTASAELADLLGEKEDAIRWRARLAEMPEFALGEGGDLLVTKDQPLEESHRHFSHLMAIHPLGLIDPDHGEAHAKVVKATLETLKRLGTKQWCGYSFAWEASLAARAGDGARAAKALNTFASAFVLRNSFHCNGDQSGKGYSNFTYRPFTLEGNFAAAAGLQEMLLQSHTGVIEVFPAVPDAWRQCSFEQLRAQGAFLVSAVRSGAKVQTVTIRAEQEGPCRVRSPWTSEEITFALKAGEERTLTPPAS